MTRRPTTLLLLAGEPSGDQHAAGVARALKQRLPDIRMVGIGGPEMASAGVDLLADLDALTVMGFAEIVSRLEYFRGLESRLRELIWGDEIDLVLPVDYPGFNLRIAALASERGRRVLYYIPPKAWAWRPGRARKLADCTDQVAAILPFEVDFFRSAGANVSFVGNPLLDRPDDVAGARAFHERWALDPDRPILAVLPGSRSEEIARHLPIFMEAVRLVCADRVDVQPIVGRALNLPMDSYAGVTCPVIDDTRGLLRHAVAGIVKSGTSTLEAALEGTPMVVPYVTSALSWQVVKRVLQVEHVALPNLIAGRTVVPEFIQEAAEPERISEALLPLLDLEAPQRGAQVDALAGVRARMGSPGASQRVADMAVELLGLPYT